MALACVLAGFVALEQTILQPPVPRTTEVAGARISRDGAGFAALGDLTPSTSVLTAEAIAGDIAIAPPPETFDVPVEPTPPPPRALRAPRSGAQLQPGTWSVVIGINDYPGSRYDLRSAVADAGDVVAALTRLGVPRDHILYLTDRQASASAISASLEWLTARAGPDAVATVFYAGHIRHLGGSRQAIVGSDGRLLSDVDMAAKLADLQAHRAWIALAACYSGGFTEVLGPGRILTAASAQDQLAYENEAFGRSYLVEYMVRRAILGGAADSSVEAAFNWARNELQRDFPNRVPVQYDQHDGILDLRPPGAPTATPRSASSGGTTSSGGSGGSGSGSSPSPSSTPPSTTTTTQRDGCSNITLGVVRCSG